MLAHARDASKIRQSDQPVTRFHKYLRNGKTLEMIDVGGTVHRNQIWLP